MSLTLSWVNHNEGFQTRIYKSAELFDVNSLPQTPVATLATGVDKWEDNEVQFGETYYYLIEFFKGETMLRSTVRKYTVDMESWNMRGIKTFGAVSGSNAFDTLMYNGAFYPATAHGNNALDSIVYEMTGVNPHNSQLFNEFIIDGRIFFMSADNMSMSVRNLIEKGFFFGDQRRNLPEGVDAEAYPESKLYDWRGHKFRPMLPSALPQNLNVTSAVLDYANMRDEKGRATVEEMLAKGGLAQTLATRGGASKHLLYVGSSAMDSVGSSYRLGSTQIATCTCNGVVDNAGNPQFITLSSIGTNASTINTTTFTINNTISSCILIEYLGVSQ